MIRLKQLRHEKHLSQAEMGKLLNITRQGYANYENGTSQPSPAILVRCADIFCCSVDYILCREDDTGNVCLSDTLSIDEKELLEIYKRQNEQAKKYLLTFARGVDNHSL